MLALFRSQVYIFDRWPFSKIKIKLATFCDHGVYFQRSKLRFFSHVHFLLTMLIFSFSEAFFTSDHTFWNLRWPLFDFSSWHFSWSRPLSLFIKIKLNLYQKLMVPPFLRWSRKDKNLKEKINQPLTHPLQKKNPLNPPNTQPLLCSLSNL